MIDNSKLFLSDIFTPSHPSLVVAKGEYQAEPERQELRCPEAFCQRPHSSGRHRQRKFRANFLKLSEATNPCANAPRNPLFFLSLWRFVRRFLVIWIEVQVKPVRSMPCSRARTCTYAKISCCSRKCWYVSLPASGASERKSPGPKPSAASPSLHLAAHSCG